MSDMEMIRYSSRAEAGQYLARRLRALGLVRPLLLAVPRGGLPVAQAIADVLRESHGGVIDLDIAPSPETESPESAEFAAITPSAAASSPGLDLSGRDVVIVDDGINTGAAVLVAIRAMRGRGAHRIIVASPIVCEGARAVLQAEDIELIALQTPTRYASLEEFFEEMEPVSDLDVHRIQSEAKNIAVHARASEERELDLGGIKVKARVTRPEVPRGILLTSAELESFARTVAEAEAHALAIVALESPSEEMKTILRRAVDWLAHRPSSSGLPIGLMFAGEGAAAALETASSFPEHVRCVIAIDPAAMETSASLANVLAPTLMLVTSVERQMAARVFLNGLGCESSCVLAENLGPDDRAIQTTRIWLERHLSQPLPERGAIANSKLEAPPAP